MFKIVEDQYILDDFKHEQSLIVRENVNLLFTGCSHNGVLSILNQAE
ncbi:MAG: hypothetical protein RBQ91_06200 [Acholeplasma sp.]|nr:hypothetical protein [Acholeplasma sp.]